MGYLEDVLLDEFDGRSTVDFAVIRNSRLDKLLADMLSRENRATPTPIQFRADMATAASLQRLWRARFRAQYFEVDQARYLDLTSTGRLKDVVYSGADEGRQIWSTRVCQELSELESNLQFEAGE